MSFTTIGLARHAADFDTAERYAGFVAASSKEIAPISPVPPCCVVLSPFGVHEAHEEGSVRFAAAPQPRDQVRGVADGFGCGDEPASPSALGNAHPSLLTVDTPIAMSDNSHRHSRPPALHHVHDGIAIERRASKGARTSRSKAVRFSR
ncbi:hypothetical protein GOD67_26745 [Sinorhizobium medicae]|nr:hypothetical protein [Sinorhizobium medicae]MDX0845785.1 hypothetical protein [Sinorhizobium medicae]